MNNSERLDYIDIAKGIGIFMVVFTHSPMFIPVIDQMSNIIIWVGAFHMPLFFIICGFTVKSPTNIDGLRKFFIKKWGGGYSVFAMGNYVFRTKMV